MKSVRLVRLSLLIALLLGSTLPQAAQPQNSSVSPNSQFAKANGALYSARQDIQKGNFESAIATLRDAIQALPDSGLLWTTLGDAQSGAKLYSDAAASYQKALDFNASSQHPNPDVAAHSYAGLEAAKKASATGAVESSDFAVIFNVPGIARLNFSPGVLSDIYLRNITNWSDPRIATDNPGVQLPNLGINAVHRVDDSKTNHAFSHYLDRQSRDSAAESDRDATVKWNGGLGANGNKGVANFVRNLEGTVGYVDLDYAIQNNLNVGAIKNAAGEWVKGSLASAKTQASQGRTRPVNGAPQCAWPKDFDLIRDPEVLHTLENQNFAQLVKQGGVPIGDQISGGETMLAQYSNSLPHIETEIRGISSPSITHYNFTFDYENVCKRNQNKDALLASECEHVNVENVRYALNGTIQIMECMAAMPLRADIGPNRDTPPSDPCDASRQPSQSDESSHGPTRVAAGNDSVVLHLSPGTPLTVAAWPGFTISATCHDVPTADACSSPPSERGPKSTWTIAASCPGFLARNRGVPFVVETRDGNTNSLPSPDLRTLPRGCPNTSGDTSSENPSYTVGPLWGSCASKSFIYLRVYPPAPPQPVSNK